ncbi:autotransporter outer membrane beta-barrel domain-containing protein [Ochrobactrum teleogrylli]|uniref:Autotransporter outer membrane beta-barrel domain-containing protein n=1 Tax=Ochrobactrum teleogrylli TaxID=2479765 RepID=A0ABY2Y3H4_9HYPH|nr:autotransporter outer membrane beta-barrel domain-containing protein [[Ochrobactrum] teleogrylli]
MYVSIYVEQLWFFGNRASLIGGVWPRSFTPISNECSYFCEANPRPATMLSLRAFGEAPVKQVKLGSTLNLDTDGSPSDRLIINGGVASGSTRLEVTNAGGQGAITTGSGILVVDTANDGTKGDRRDPSRGSSRGWPLRILAYRGSIDASGQENWYLRSELTPVPPTPPTPPHQHRLFHPSNQSRTQHLITDQKCSFMLQYFRWEPFMAGS